MGKTVSTRTGTIKFVVSGGVAATPAGFNLVSWEHEDSAEIASHKDSGSGGGTSKYAGNTNETVKVVWGASTAYQYFVPGVFYDVELHLDNSGNNYFSGTIVAGKTSGTGAKVVDAANQLVRTTDFEVDGKLTPNGTLDTLV